MSEMTFEDRLAFLNEEQREAVDTIDGPLLVIAGPGTGKTQLLSLRAANILHQRDVTAGNLLCLTFTDAGAEAMRKRLVELIGREAYGIEVATFHSFASGLRSRYPEYFQRGASSSVITNLEQRRFVERWLDGLSPANPLYSTRYNDTHKSASTLIGFISRLKRSGLTPDEFRTIVHQTIETLDYLEESTPVLSYAGIAMNGGKAKKAQIVAAFEEDIAKAFRNAPEALKRRRVATPGVYEPYLQWLADFVANTPLIDENGKVTGFNEVRDQLFGGSAKEGRTFADRVVCERALEAANLYERYEAFLLENDYCDYDDMILGAIQAIRASAEFQQRLQDRYRYIQVDEFQDTNASQMAIVELLIEGQECPNVMAVGDDDQAIMRFQGASVAGIVQFSEKTHPKSVVLKTNYRSTPAIVRLGQDIAVQIEQRLPESAKDKALVAFRDEGDQRTFSATIFQHSATEYYELARDIRRRIDEGYREACEKPDEAIAVIAPKRQSLESLIPFLNHFDVPFAYDFRTNVFSMESMQTLLALIRATAALSQGSKQRAAAELPRIIAAPELGISTDAAIAFALFARREHGGDWLSALQTSTNARIGRLGESLREWAASAAGTPLRAMIFAMAQPLMEYYRARVAEDPLAFAEFNSGIRALLHFAEGEIAAAGRMQHTLRLPEFSKLVDTASKYGVTIDGSVTFGRPDAVQLRTAHGSKGLEYDLVYLLDTDDGKWRRGASSLTLCPHNMYLTNERDEDDIRRLLFVAVTRAKRHLEVYSAREQLVKELVGLVEPREREVLIDEIADVIETDWRQFFALDTPEKRELLAPDLSTYKLSPSALNDFVHYEPGCTRSADFPTKRLLRLPRKPNDAAEFGTVVHAFLQDYVNKVIQGDDDVETLARRYRAWLRALDVDEEAIPSFLRRFDGFLPVFPPRLTEILGDSFRTEVPINVTLLDEVPMTGKCDLLLIDETAKTVKVVDYKTGFSYPGAKPTPDYERQLQCYKLMIEQSPDFAGYRVVQQDDLYIEPEKGTTDVLHPPVECPVSDDDLDHLRALISAVWHRIQARDFDTSAFETSDAYAEALVTIKEKSPRVKKPENSPYMQRAYEDWLIARDVELSGR